MSVGGEEQKKRAQPRTLQSALSLVSTIAE